MTTTIEMATQENGNSTGLETFRSLDSSAPAGVDTIVPTRAPVEARVNNTFFVNNDIGLNASGIKTGPHMQALGQGYTDYVMQEIQDFFDLLASGGRRQTRWLISGSLVYADGSAVIDQIDDIPCSGTGAVSGLCQQVQSSFSVIVGTDGADPQGYAEALAQQAADGLLKQTQSNILSPDGGLEKFLNGSDGGSDLHIYAIPSASPTTEPATSPVALDTLSPSIRSINGVDTLSPSYVPTLSPVPVPPAVPVAGSTGAAASTSDAPSSIERKPLVAGMSSLLCIALILCVVACVLLRRRQRRQNEAKTDAIDYDDTFSVAHVSGARNTGDCDSAYLCDNELQSLGIAKDSHQFALSPKASLRNLAMFEQRPDGSQQHDVDSHVSFLASVLNFDLPRRGNRELVTSNGDINDAGPDEQSFT